MEFKLWNASNWNAQAIADAPLITVETLEQFLELIREQEHDVIIGTPGRGYPKDLLKDTWTLVVYDDYLE